MDCTPLTLGRACATAWPRPEFILGPLQAGDVGMIAGADGLGKSWVALAAGLAVATGQPEICGGMWDVPQGVAGRVLMFAVEDREADHGRRLAATAKHCRMEGEIGQIEEDDDSLTLIPLLGQRLALVQKSGDKYQVTAAGEAWAKQIQGYRMVIIDPLRAFHNLDESDGAGMDFLVRWLVSIAMTNQQVILLVHHASQGAILDRRSDHHAGRGATDLPAGCRAVWTLRAGQKEEDGTRWRELVNGKASHGPESNARHLRPGIGGVLYCADPPQDDAAGGGIKSKAAKPSISKINLYQNAKNGQRAPALAEGEDDEDY
ncbi:MAG: AAA family ATPase [Candidatus Igneacidithiobacillus chanchocoensis]